MNSSEQPCRPPLEGRVAAIAAAARALIAECGFEGLRMRDIAARVGINVATLHYHVPTKQALIAIVAQSLRADFVAQHAARPRDGLTPLDVLRLEFLDFRETLTTTPERFVVMAELSERARRDEEIAAEVRPMQAFWRRQIAGVVESGMVAGQFRADIDAEAAAAMIIGTMISAARQPETTLAFFDRACAELVRALVSCETDLKGNSGCPPKPTPP